MGAEPGGGCADFCCRARFYMSSAVGCIVCMRLLWLVGSQASCHLARLQATRPWGGDWALGSRLAPMPPRLTAPHLHCHTLQTRCWAPAGPTRACASPAGSTRSARWRSLPRRSSERTTHPPGLHPDCKQRRT